MSYRFLTIKTLATLLLTAASSLALAAPTPFTAHYRLDISGWPDATITHTLSRQDDVSSPGEVWESDMRASIKVASGDVFLGFLLQHLHSGDLCLAELVKSDSTSLRCCRNAQM